MAIEDNTLYGLTGAQIKELPGKIEAVKGLARELTTDDYNYPADNPTSVALWLLDAGVYMPQDGNVSVKAAGVVDKTGAGYIYLVGPANNSDYKLIWCFAGRSCNMYDVHSSGKYYMSARNISSVDIINNLTSTSATSPLSANQGKVLKDLIDSLVISGTGAPTTSTAGTKGKLYEDTTNGKLYQCTNVSGSTYTWTEITKTSIYSATGRGQTGGLITENLSSLSLAGKPESGLPYALMTGSGDGQDDWSYIRGVQDNSTGIRTAYVGSYTYDWQEDWWSGKHESRLAMYSDLSNKTTLNSKIQANVNTPISSLNIAGNGTDTYPYAPCYYEDSNSGRELWSYIRAYPIFGDITQAYVGKYGYDAGESYWNGKKETRLALYSDLPATFTTNEWNALWA